MFVSFNIIISIDLGYCPKLFLDTKDKHTKNIYMIPKWSELRKAKENAE